MKKRFGFFVFICLLILPQARAEAPALHIPDSTVERLLKLNPDSISADEVNEVLKACPAPRILVFNGSLGSAVRADSISKFLIQMGYPEERIVSSRDGKLSSSSFASSRALAEELIWYYENEGWMPVLVGHSQGGMITIKTLHELAGTFGSALKLWNPAHNQRQARSDAVNPWTGRRERLNTLRVPLAFALASGELMRFFLGQWDMIGKMRSIPDSVDTFVGFHAPGDLLGSAFGSENAYRALGRAHVMNVFLPKGYDHVNLVQVEPLAQVPESRAWIERFNPEDEETNAAEYESGRPILVAAHIWYWVKRNWCLELQSAFKQRSQTAV